MNSFLSSENNLIPRDGEIFYFPSFFSSEESDEFFATLLREIIWKQEPIKIFGKERMQPRLTAWYGDQAKSYTYSGITMSALAWTPTLQNIRAKIELISRTKFTNVLLNFYRDGQDSMGWHSDNEKELGLNPIIGSVSFGATRRFRLRHRQNKEMKVDINLEHGSYLTMRGEVQHHWLHSVPKASAVTSPRINLTFRTIERPD